MLNVEFTNSLGESISIGSCFPYILGKNSGLSTNDVTTMIGKGYNQNGSYYYGTLDNARVISMTVYFSCANDNECKEKRKYISRVFNPRLGLGRLTYEDNTGKYIIDAVVSLKPRIYRLDDKAYSMTRAFDVILTCPKPDWLSYDSTQIKMVDFIGGLKLPFVFPFTLAERGDGGNIDYTGDNPASVVLDFRVKDGGSAVVNPKVENHLGEYIELSKTINAGQKVIIDTNPDAPSITFVDTDGSVSDAWDSLVFGSKFFQLYNGENIFRFTATGGDPELYLTYRNHYTGV